jgi:hypothetical protein
VGIVPDDTPDVDEQDDYDADGDDDDDGSASWQPVEQSESVAEARDTAMQELIGGQQAYEPYRAVLDPDVQYIHQPYTSATGVAAVVDLLVAEAQHRLRLRGPDVMGVEYDSSDFRESGLNIVRAQEVQRLATMLPDGRRVMQTQRRVIEDFYWIHVDLYVDERYLHLPSEKRPREWRISKLELVQTLVNPLRFARRP